MKRRQTGFTLVEILIVLVIMGLLLAGIFKGQDMIMQAKTKNIIADFSGTSAAYHGYRDRYRAIPGDDNGAATRWTSPPAVSGNGNGMVGGTYNADCTGATLPESCLWWDHLRRAGFVPGSGAQQQINASGGIIGVQTGDGTGGAIFGGFSGLIMCVANLPGKIAKEVDTQMDDGDPRTGMVRGMLQTTSNPSLGPGAAASATYNEADTSAYVLCRAL